MNLSYAKQDHKLNSSKGPVHTQASRKTNLQYDDCKNPHICPGRCCPGITSRGTAGWRWWCRSTARECYCCNGHVQHWHQECRRSRSRQRAVVPPVTLSVPAGMPALAVPSASGQALAAPVETWSWQREWGCGSGISRGSGRRSAGNGSGRAAGSVSGGLLK